MDTKKNHYIKQLIENKIMETDEQYELFEDSIENLADLSQIDDIPILCKGFDDSTKEDEVMFGLVHLIENLEGDRFIDLIIQGILGMKQESRDWAKLLIKRILNSDHDREAYRLAFQQLDISSKNEMIVLLKEIQNDNPEKFEKKIEEIIKQE